MLDGAFHAEYGAVRIEPDLQPLMHEFVQELKVPVELVSSHEAGSSIRPCLDRLTQNERAVLADPHACDPVWTLLLHAVRAIAGGQWDLDRDSLGRPGRAEELRHFRADALHADVPLYRQGIWNVLTDVLSYEAVEFAREKGAFYNFKNVNANAAGWITTLLDLRLIEKGPALVIDTACSSSLVAVHQELGALAARQCDAAIVGGASLILTHDYSVDLAQAGMLSADGRCKAFTKHADRFARGERVGAIPLMQHADAKLSRKRIYATH